MGQGLRAITILTVLFGSSCKYSKRYLLDRHGQNSITLIINVLSNEVYTACMYCRFRISLSLDLRFLLFCNSELHLEIVQIAAVLSRSDP